MARSPASPAPAALADSRAELRWLADTYEQAQRIRLEAGERIRAVLQGRDGGSSGDVAPDARDALARIRRGESDGPVPVLGRTYRRHWEAERDLRAAMARALARHPAWPWMSTVPGVGPTLAGKLLARLDLGKANCPASFWAYCGLGTVEGPDGMRVAQPGRARGTRTSYDPAAKRICYLLGVSFLRAGGPYRDAYDDCRARLTRGRPGWTAGRIHLASLRFAEKRFLRDLWSAWSHAVSRLPEGAAKPSAAAVPVVAEVTEPGERSSRRPPSGRTHAPPPSTT